MLLFFFFLRKISILPRSILPLFVFFFFRKILVHFTSLFSKPFFVSFIISVGNFCNNNYIEHGSSDERNKNLPVKEYLDKIKPYLRDVIINLQKSNA